MNTSKKEKELSFRKTTKLIFQIIKYNPTSFITACVLFTLFHLTPFGMAYLVSLIFEKVNIMEAKGISSTELTYAWIAVGGILLIRSTRYFIFYNAVIAWIKQMYLANTLIRANLLDYLLNAPGTRQLKESASEAVSRFRDDVNEVGIMFEQLIDFFGMLIFTVITLVIMFTISPLLMVTVYTPMFAVVVIVKLLSPTIRRYRRKMREAEAKVADFIGESFAAVNSIKLAAKEPQILAHLVKLGEIRKKAALKDTLVTELITSMTRNMMRIATGILLLVGAYLIQLKKMQINDIVLIIGLLPMLMFSTHVFAQLFTQQKRITISFERFKRLLFDASYDDMVKHTNLYLETENTPNKSIQRKTTQLDTLEIKNLTVKEQETVVVNNVSFTVNKGDFIVITGKMGSGKSSLVKAILGLGKKHSGTILWNNQKVDDPASFFIPPISAYTAQIPNLFSDSLEENILMGTDNNKLAIAIDLAVLKADLDAMPNDLLTEVGARGVKLSGGQVQRTAIARMLTNESELLVFDDVSSALDTATEQQLWKGLFSARNSTCLVVSNRQPALERADTILLMDNGELIDQGKLSALIRRQPLMQTIWAKKN